MESLKYIFLILAAFFLPGCSTDTVEIDNPGEPETKGMVNVEITEQLGETDDKMEHVRFFIFNNNGSIPIFELNERFDISAASPENHEISKFKVTLEVNMQSGKENNKIVVAIINEPPGLTNELQDINEYSRLVNMQLNFGDFLNSQHTGLQTDKTMPMAGVVWTNKVYTTEEMAANNPAQMSVWRAPARVDVYLRKEAGMDFTLASGTEITLKNTYDKEPLIRYENGSNTFGRVQTIDSGFLDKKWSITESDNKDIPVVSNDNKGRLICSFYTPERTCMADHDTDKLILVMHVMTNEGTTRKATIVIDKFMNEAVEKSIDRLSRNNIYRVIATVGTESITAIVQDWKSEDINTEL